MTLVAVATMVAATTVLGTTPAQAKGEQGPGHAWRCPVGGNPYCPAGRVVIQGPGLGHGVTLQGRAFWTVWYLSGLDTRPFGAEEPSPPPRDRIGPGYQATYVVKARHGRSLTLGQVLYPYAPGMVWAFTPSGQRFHDDWHAYTAPGGWWHSVALREFLLGHWLPAAAPGLSGEADRSAGGASVSPGDGGGPGEAVWIGIVALAALLLASAVAARPRRTTTEVGR